MMDTRRVASINPACLRRVLADNVQVWEEISLRETPPPDPCALLSNHVFHHLGGGLHPSLYGGLFTMFP